MIFTEINEKEYKVFLDNHEQKTFLHTPYIAEIRKKDGWTVNYVGVKKNDVIIAATMLLSRKEFLNKKEFVAIRGFLIDYNDFNLLSFFVKEVNSFIKKHNGFMLRTDPYLIKQERDIDGNIVKNGINNFKAIDNLKKIGFKEKNAEQANWMFILDLKEKSIEQLFKNMKQNTRNYINKTFKDNLIIRELKFDELEKFKKVTDDTSIRRNFSNKGITYFQDMFKLFGENNEIKFIVAELDTNQYLEILINDLKKQEDALNAINEKNTGKIKDKKIKINSINTKIEEAKKLVNLDNKIILSAAMFILYGDEVVYFSSGNYREYIHFHAQYRIQYEMIKYATEHNFKIYNFYGISGNFDEKDSRYGVYQFKKSFNGNVVELIGEYKLCINKPIYILYNSINSIKKLIKTIIGK